MNIDPVAKHIHEAFWIVLIAVGVIAIPAPLFWIITIGGLIGLLVIWSAILNRKDSAR